MRVARMKIVERCRWCSDESRGRRGVTGRALQGRERAASRRCLPLSYMVVVIVIVVITVVIITTIVIIVTTVVIIQIIDTTQDHNRPSSRCFHFTLQGRRKY